MNRDPQAIQQEIDHARVALGTTLDQLVERTNPKRLVAQGKASLTEFALSPKGKKIIGGTVAAFAALAIIRRVQERRARR